MKKHTIWKYGVVFGHTDKELTEAFKDIRKSVLFIGETSKLPNSLAEDVAELHHASKPDCLLYKTYNGSRFGKGTSNAKVALESLKTKKEAQDSFLNHVIIVKL